MPDPINPDEIPGDNLDPDGIEAAARQISSIGTKTSSQGAAVLSAWQKIVIDCLPQTTYANEPGTTYLYSNIGYASLGLAIERAGGKPFTDQVTERILNPLGMNRSAFEPNASIMHDLAHGYRRQNDKADRSAPDRELEGRGYRVPNGALFSTVTARRFCDQQEMSLHTATGRSLP